MNARNETFFNEMSQNEIPKAETIEPTEAQWAQAMEWLRANPYGEQDENGIDISLLRENLKLTPTQRIENNIRALRIMMELQRGTKAA